MGGEIGARAQFLPRAVFIGTLIVAPIVETAARLRGGPGILQALQQDLFAQFACAGVYIMYRLWERDERRARAATMLGAGGALAGLGGSMLAAQPPVFGLGLALALLGAVAFGCMAWAASIGPARERAYWRERLAPACVVPLGVAMAPFFLWLSSQVNPVYDLYVFAFEEMLGPRFSVLAAALADSVPPLGFIAALCYVGLPFGIAALYALQRPARPDADIIVAFAVAAGIGFSLYFVFPVVGPLTLYGDAFPHALPPSASIVAGDVVIAQLSPRNGMPSLHTVWALLVWFNARALEPWPRRMLRLFASLNLVGTMTMHDAHWLSDLIVAQPLAVAVQALCTMGLPLRSAARWTAVGGGFGLVAAWLALLLWDLPFVELTAELAWLAVFATIATSVALERHLRVDAARARASRIPADTRELQVPTV